MNATFIICLIFLLVVSRKVSTKRPPKLSSAGVKSNHIVKVGQDIKLLCPVENTHDSSILISWSKDEEAIHLGWAKHKQSENLRFLKILKLEVEDSGAYICRATNGFGAINFKHLLFVYDNITTPPPDINFNEEVFIHLPGKEMKPRLPKNISPFLNVIAGNTAHLFCLANGRPRPEVIWFKNNIQLSIEEVKELAGNSKEDFGVLTIRSTKKKDEGSYTCKAVNGAGTASFTYQLYVDSSHEEANFLMESSQNLTVAYGHQAKLECVVQSSVVPIVQWLRPFPKSLSNDQKFSNNTFFYQNEYYLTLKGTLSSPREGLFVNTLILDSVHRYDYGIYICSVVDGQKFKHKDFFIIRKSELLNSESYGEDALEGDKVSAYFLMGIVLSVIILFFIIFLGFFCCKNSSYPKTKSPLIISSNSCRPNSAIQNTSPTNNFLYKQQQQLLINQPKFHNEEINQHLSWQNQLNQSPTKFDSSTVINQKYQNSYNMMTNIDSYSPEDYQKKQLFNISTKKSHPTASSSVSNNNHDPTTK